MHQRLVGVIEQLKGRPEGVGALPDLDGLQHSQVLNLLKYKPVVQTVLLLGLVGLYASDKVELRRLEFIVQGSELLVELGHESLALELVIVTNGEESVQECLYLVGDGVLILVPEPIDVVGDYVLSV